MTRILTLSNMYPPHSLGGYERSCDDVMRRLTSRGHEVTVLTTDMRVGGIADPLHEPFARVHRDLRFYWRDHVLLRPPTRDQWAIERHNHAALARAIELARPEVVSVWNMGAMSLSLLTAIERAGIPMVLAVCDDWLIYAPRLDPWTATFARVPSPARGVIDRLVGVPVQRPQLTDAVFCFVSDATRRRAQQAGAWAIGRSTVVYSGIEAGEFSPLPAGVDHEWRGRLLYVGRLDDRKGIETLLRAVARLPDTTLDLVGHGDAEYRSRLDALAAGLGITDRVTFDAVPRGELAATYRSADVVVFPSEWAEPFGLVPLEAMACGTPVIATCTGGSAEFLRDETNCLAFPPGDEHALAAAVLRLESDPALRRRLVVAGADLAAHFTTDRLADVMEEWHVAAAARFRDGVPADLPAPLTVKAPPDAP
jgi:glycosyltransferase involved in cell wall biosynthesis